MIVRARSLAQARAKSTVAPEASTVQKGSPAAKRVPGGDRSTAQSGQFRRSGAHNVARGVNDFGRFERQARRRRRQTSFARGDMTRKQWSLVRFEHVQRRPGRGLISMSQTASAETRKSALLRPTRSSSRSDRMPTERAISSACAGSTSTGPAAPPYRNGDAGVGAVHCMLRPMISAFFSPARNKSRDALSANATLKIRIRRSAARGFRRGDMGASGAAPPLHEPEFGLVRRRKRNLRMPHAIRLANPRERDRILGALQRFRIIAKYPCPAGDRRDRFRLMLEAGAIDEPNRIMGADQHFDGAGDLVEREPLRQSAVELHRGKAHLSRVIVAKDINRERSKSRTGGGGSERARRIGHNDDCRTVSHTTPMFNRSRTWRQGLGISSACAIVCR